MRRCLVLLLLAAACGTDDPAPTARVVSFTPEELVPSSDLSDDLHILVEYDDADGDLGDGIAQIHDCRGDALLTELAIPAIAPDDVVGSPIHGSLDLYVNDIGAATSSALPAACEELGVSTPGADETVFCVVLVDAAGHAGAGDCTSPIALVP
jgi:hypothetical protein